MMPSRRCCGVFGEIGLHQEFVNAEPDGGRHPRLQSAIGQHDDRQVRLGKHAGRPHDAHDLASVQHRHVPIQDHDVRVDGAHGVDRGKPVARFVGRLAAEVGQHHAGQPARIGVAVRNQDNQAFHGLLDLLASHLLTATGPRTLLGRGRHHSGRTLSFR
jgi:hypothetical protein